jgi:hypothetical protein
LSGVVPDEVGVVLGHQAATSQSFEVGVGEGSSLEVDDLVAVTTPDPAGEVTTYGIVAESYARLEGASLPSDTAVIAAGQMPGELVRTADVQVMRVEPERWIAAHPGLTVRRAAGADRAKALYEDTMERTLAIGLARDGLPVKLDLDFLDGTKGGHVSISGISGVATKTSTALALVRLLLEHPLMRRRVRVLIFNVKGEDLMHIDRPNRRYAERPDVADLDRRWRALGLVEAGPFPSVGFWAPPQPDGRPSCDSRHEGVRAFGWTPLRFAFEGLLRFCFAEAADMRNQLSFVEERVRGELARRAVPVTGHPGALGLLDGPAEADPEGRRERLPSELAAGPFADLRELVSLGEVADFVAAAGAGNFDLEVAAGHLAQRAVEARHRAGDAEEGERHRGDQRGDHDDRHDQVDLVGALGVGHHSVLGDLRIPLRRFDGRLHQAGDIGGGLHGAVGDDVALGLLSPNGFLVGGQEALDQRGEVADHDQQFAVIGFAAQLVEDVLQRGLGLGHLGDQVGIAGGAELPGAGAQRIHLAVGLEQQALDLEAVVQLLHRRQFHLGVDRLVPFLRNDRALLDLSQQRGLRLGEILHGGGKAFHQALGFLQPLLGVGLLSHRQRRLQFLCRALLVALQIGDCLLDLGGFARHPDVGGGELDFAQVDMRGERAVRDLLRPCGALAGLLDSRLGNHLVGDHSDRQQDADRAGQAQFISDTVELDHVDDPIFLAIFPEAEFAHQRTSNLRARIPRMLRSVAETG